MSSWYLIAALLGAVVLVPTQGQSTSSRENTGSECSIFIEMYSNDNLTPSDVESFKQEAAQAIAKRDGQAVRLLVLQGAPVALFAGTEEQKMAIAVELEKKLILDSAAGRIRQVRGDLRRGADVNAVPERDAWMPALHWAAICNQAAVVRLLLDSGADPNLGAFYAPGVDEPEVIPGFTPLMAAASQGSIEVVKSLLARGAQINVHSGPAISSHPGIVARYGKTTALISAAPDVVALLLAAGARPNETKEDGQTALFGAAYYGETQTVALLLHAGADPCQRDKNGHTATDAANDTPVPASRDAITRMLNAASAHCPAR